MKRKLFLMGTLTLIVAGGIFWSCQKEELLNPEDGLMLKKGKVETTETTVPLAWDTPICAGEEHEFSIDAVLGTNLQVQVEINPGEWIQIFQVSKSDASPQLFTYTFDETGTYNLRVKVGAGGFTYDVTVEVISCGCEAADFSYETTDNLAIEFKYNHDVEAELTIEFTFPQVIVSVAEGHIYTGADGKEYSINPKNPTVFSWTGFVGCTADDAETFKFVHTADCGPSTAKDGEANIWTDAKIVAVNGVPLIDDVLTLDINESYTSLKGSLSNIEYSGCPITK